jgi:preprotein translocase SecE subunit
MQSKDRYVVVSILSLAVIIAVSLSHGLEWIWVWGGWDDAPLLSRELTTTVVLAYAVSTAAAVYSIKHKPTYQLAYEVVEELTKVTWPSREETGNATVVVIVTVVICAAFLGVFDAVWLWLTDWLLGAGDATL